MDPQRRKMMLEMLRSGEDSDITIKCDGREWHAHKLILRTTSPTFKAQLSGSWRESQEGVVTQELFDADIMDSLLVWIYTEEYLPPDCFSEAARLGRENQETTEGSEAQASENEERDTAVTDALLKNIKVFCISDYYAISTLAERAAAAYAELLKYSASTYHPSSIITALTQGGTATSKLQAMYSKLLVPRMLAQHGGSSWAILQALRGLEGSNDFFCQIIEDFIKFNVAQWHQMRSDHAAKIGRVQADLDEVRVENTQLKMDQIGLNQQLVDKSEVILSFVNVVGALPTECRNGRCKSPLQLSFVEKGNKHWRVQCAKCKCRLVG